MNLGTILQHQSHRAIRFNDLLRRPAIRREARAHRLHVLWRMPLPAFRVEMCCLSVLCGDVNHRSHFREAIAVNWATDSLGGFDLRFQCKVWRLVGPGLDATAGISLAGLGALLGLMAPRPELATIAGQLGMSLVMFLGLVPAHRLPGVVQAVRAVVPSTYAVDAFAESFKRSPNWTTISADLGICIVVCVLALAASTWAFRRAVSAR